MKIYNTLSRKKEKLVPADAGEIKLYSCGPTVYDYFHIGNARPFIVFDTLRRYLEYRGNKVNFVQNFTDVDDKIIRKANAEGVSPSDVSERYIDEYFKDAAALHIKPATAHPKVTENIPEIIEMVSTLIDKGFAYEMDGDVYFSARKFPGYGKLSKKNIDELESGARVDIDERKKDPLDFALWKKAKEGEPSWDSPWGKGRPGWHIECSVMSRKYLGDTIDIHGGGQDLIFPHHENEIAQSEAATGKPFSLNFMHNGYININDKKMSKSLGNFKTVRDILQKFDGETLRFFILSAHYRSPINFTDKILAQAQSGLRRLRDFKGDLEAYAPPAKPNGLPSSDRLPPLPRGGAERSEAEG
jgi:cysteinyl-tRNA synthetase